MRNLQFCSLVVTDKQTVQRQVLQRIEDGWAIYGVFKNKFLGYPVITFVAGAVKQKATFDNTVNDYPDEFVYWIKEIPLNQKLEKYSIYNVFFKMYKKVSPHQVHIWIKKYCALNNMSCLFKKTNGVERLTFSKNN